MPLYNEPKIKKEEITEPKDLGAPEKDTDRQSSLKVSGQRTKTDKASRKRSDTGQTG